MTNAPRVVHLSADYPDPLEPAKTQAIRTLIELTDGEFASDVISLNRCGIGMPKLLREMVAGGGRPALRLTEAPFAHGAALSYRAPGKGLFHRTMLEQLGEAVAARLRNGPPPDLLVGHKLTVEGIAVARASALLGAPYALTVQGDTDTKILAARPDLSGLFRSIYHGATMVTFLAPWTREAVEKRLGRRHGGWHIIPCPTELDQPVAPDPAGEGFITVFHLRNYRRKNLATTATALSIANQHGAGLTLSVVGGGNADDAAAARRAARVAGASVPGLGFEGPIAREDMARRMNRATGLVLPSRRESFGLVFVEALLAGCPVIYPRGQAIDGYLPDRSFAMAVDANRPADIAAAMRRLSRESVAIKQELEAWQASVEARQFTRPAIGLAYRQALRAALVPLAPHKEA